MAGGKTDRRVLYTRMVMKQSLLELMKTTDINRITVKAICERADINRGTFYAHYSEPRELLKQIENDFTRSITDTISRHGIDATDTFGMISDIVQRIYENGDICKTLLGEHGDATFLNELLYEVQKKCVDLWSVTMADAQLPMLEYLYSFIALGSVGVLRKWIANDMAESPQLIATAIDKMTYKGLRGFAEKK